METRKSVLVSIQNIAQQLISTVPSPEDLDTIDNLLENIKERMERVQKLWNCPGKKGGDVILNVDEKEIIFFQESGALKEPPAEDVVRRYCEIRNDGFDRHIDEINRILPLLIEKVPPDVFIPWSEPLLFEFAAIPQVNYEFLFAKKKRSVDCNIRKSSAFGYTPLIWACVRKNTKAVQLLLEHGADPNILVHGWYTPLVALCRYSICQTSIQILELLIEYNANVNPEFQDTDKFPPIFHLVRTYYQMEHPSEQERQDFPSEQERQDFYLFLTVLLGADINKDFVNKEGETALHIVCYFGDVEAAKILVEHGFDYKVRDKEGRLPQDRFRNIEIKKQFLDWLEIKDCR